MKTMKVITWNVNGIRARHAEVQGLMTAESPDVVCLQEVKASPTQVPDLLVSTADHWSYWHGSGGYSGVAVIVRHSFVTERPVFHHPSFDMESRIVVADLGSTVVASVYVPNGGKDYAAKLTFFGALVDWAGETIAGGRDVIICGDLNIAREERDVHPKERKPNQIGTRPEERALLARMLDAGLVDVGRSLDPDNNELFTWWAPWRNLRQRNIGWRIDYVLASRAVAASATTSASRRDFGTSDHGPVVVQFDGAAS
jgi:exodeoxyribonuclease-3